METTVNSVTIDGYTAVLLSDGEGILRFPDDSTEEFEWQVGHGDECDVLHVDLPRLVPFQTRCRLADALVEPTGADARSPLEDEWY